MGCRDDLNIGSGHKTKLGKSGLHLSAVPTVVREGALFDVKEERNQEGFGARAAGETLMGRGPSGIPWSDCRQLTSSFTLLVTSSRQVPGVARGLVLGLAGGEQSLSPGNKDGLPAGPSEAPASVPSSRPAVTDGTPSGTGCILHTPNPFGLRRSRSAMKHKDGRKVGRNWVDGNTSG